MLSTFFILVLVIAPWLYLSYLNGDAVLFRPRCPECRQARVRQIRDLGERWGWTTRFSTCPACGRHFRHDDDGMTQTGGGPSLVTNDAAPR